MLGFNDTSNLVGHFVSSTRERENEEIVEEIKAKKNVYPGLWNYHARLVQLVRNFTLLSLTS